MKTKGFIRGVPYRLARTYGTKHTNTPPDDICLFLRAVVKGFFVTLFITLVGFFLGLLMLDFALTSILYLSGVGTGYYFSVLTFAWGAFLWLIAVIIVVVVGVCYTLENTAAGDKVDEYFERRAAKRKKQEMKAREEPGLIKMWYRSVKDKVCFKIKFDD